MAGRLVYHVVTERPMRQGQRLFFGPGHYNGVYARVMGKLELVKEIYAHPEDWAGKALEHHTAVALRELAMEEVRAKSYPQYPSRMACLYVSETLAEAEEWAAFFARDCRRPTYHIVKLIAYGNVFAGDACSCFDGTADKAQNLALAEKYWQSSPSAGARPVKELLVDGDIEVAGIVREINRNI